MKDAEIGTARIDSVERGNMEVSLERRNMFYGEGNIF